ncbi:GNAT family N-acetyltransferase [Clostridium estertheticum]|nr:GNAT family N-acetyltransferase [Clostridium estertheticum]MBZ9687416.1 GNAT family N-acetyltransferase [Clostridium estertheticum]
MGFYASMNLNEEVIYIVVLYVLTDYQRKGYGGKVLDEIII